MTTIRGKNVRMDKAIHTMEAMADQHSCTYKIAWNKWMDDYDREGFTFAQVLYQLNLKGCAV